MRVSTKFLIPSLFAALALSACGSSSDTSGSARTVPRQPTAAKSPSVETSGLVKTAANSKLGTTILVDDHGMTLYRLSGEQNGRFICASTGCLKVWHPLIAAGSFGPGSTLGSLSTASRPGIGKQITYKGMPLYTFAQDKATGEANGQGIKDVGVWNAVTATASPASAPSAPAAPAQPAPSGGGGSGY
jgi:predicted lipoprotein with Yx(FWY)xxD motif